jgi:uncharacterized membrane protein YgcG
MRSLTDRHHVQVVLPATLFLEFIIIAFVVQSRNSLEDLLVLYFSFTKPFSRRSKGGIRRGGGGGKGGGGGGRTDRKLFKTSTNGS